MCVSAGLLPCFSVSAGFRSPGGCGSLHGSTGEALEPAADAAYNLCVCLSCEHLLPGASALHSGIVSVSLLVSCIYTPPLVGYQQSTPDT